VACECPIRHDGARFRWFYSFRWNARGKTAAD